MGNEGGGYSLNRFRKAEGKWEEHLKPDEKEFLDRYRKAREDMQLNVLGVMNPFQTAAMVLAGLLKSEGREALFGGKKKAAGLEDKYKKVASADQLDKAHDEAGKLDEEYNKLLGDIGEAIENFEKFVAKLNTAKRMPRVPEREEE